MYFWPLRSGYTVSLQQGRHLEFGAQLLWISMTAVLHTYNVGSLSSPTLLYPPLPFPSPPPSPQVSSVSPPLPPTAPQ